MPTTPAAAPVRRRPAPHGAVRWWAWYARFYDRLWDGPLSERLAAAVVRLAGPPVGLTLDIGCGTGLVSQRLVHSGHSVVGVDPSLTMLHGLIRRLPRTQVVGGSIDHPPLRPGCARTVVATNLLHLHPRPALAIERLADLLEPAGRLVCSWPRDDAGPRRIARAEYRAGLSAASIAARGAARLVLGLAAPTSLHRTAARGLDASIVDVAARRGFTMRRVDLTAAEQTIVCLRQASSVRPSDSRYSDE